MSRKLISLLVALGAGPADAGALRGVEHPELDAGRVGVDPHFAAEGVDLPDNLPLGLATDGRVAGHLPDRVKIHGQEQRLAPHPRRTQGSLDPGMAGADDDHIINLGVFEHSPGSLSQVGICDKGQDDTPMSPLVHFAIVMICAIVFS